MKKLAVAVMAAGHSRRFGSPKLLSLLSGSPLIVWTLDKLANVNLAYLVTHDEQLQSLARTRGIMPLVPHGELKSDSLKASVSAAKQGRAEGLLCLQADQPLLLHQTLQRFYERFEQEELDLLYLSYQDRRSSPMLFSANVFDELLELHGDKGGSVLLDKKRAYKVGEIEAEAAFELMDVDVAEDLMRIEAFVAEYKSRSDKARC